MTQEKETAPVNVDAKLSTDKFVVDEGNLQFDCAGCLECGTCRVLCGETILKKWEFPQGTFGVEFRFG